MAGPLLNSDGSAEWREGASPRSIKVVTSVNGPIEAKNKDERPQDVSIELVYRPSSGVPMIRERLIQDKLHAAILAAVRGDLMPRSLVQVVVQLTETFQVEKSWVVDPMQDPLFFAEISAGINAMSLALLNSGVPCSGVLAAASYAVTCEGKIVKVVDLAKGDTIRSLHAVAYLFKGEDDPKLVMCESLGQFSEPELLKILETPVELPVNTNHA